MSRSARARRGWREGAVASDGGHSQSGPALRAACGAAGVNPSPHNSQLPYNITSFYGSSCANNGKDALNTPEALPSSSSSCPFPTRAVPINHQRSEKLSRLFVGAGDTMDDIGRAGGQRCGGYHAWKGNELYFYLLLFYPLCRRQLLLVCVKGRAPFTFLPAPLSTPLSTPFSTRTGLGLVHGTSTLRTELTPGNAGCSQRW
eukprot:1176112-Prorocentrum_minimum.AAC.1